MASLQVFVFLLGLVVLCHSDCFFEELTIKDVNNPPKGCVDKDGKQRDFGSEWVTDCKQCFCSKEGLSCCNMIPDADTVEVPEECELVVDKATCSSRMVQKSDKAKDCDPV
ncbi:beta-microseminoprotein [Mugil cephalus]|uniref:beta-microseminoprotein n=1 Tax=Mugil cephalus TaxID=48193 RepID=UPI001FB63A66|nr:beta-microseminoprotein [Mugil cephalus]